ncbi:MAG: hypothetical protein NTW29_11585 [Bacteroidetes bacterium]|nr:hypothetical protein [Bacteroidota bacterium]
MLIITDVLEANKLLKSLEGADFSIALYSETLKRIAIRLKLVNTQEVVYIIGIGCQSMYGKFSFRNSVLQIVTEKMTSDEESVIRIFDILSGFELVVDGGFTIAIGMEAEFGDSFDNFIISA